MMMITVHINHDGEDAFELTATGDLDDLDSAEPRAQELAEVLVAQYKRSLLGAKGVH